MGSNFSITMSPLAKTLLIVHVTMAVIMVGTGYVYPLLLANMKAGGAARVVLARVMKMIARGFTMPFVLIQPLTGAGLILTTNNLWNPFRPMNRWLFAAIVLFIVIFLLDTFVAAPVIRDMNRLAEAGNVDGPEFERLLGRVKKVGPVFGILFLTITVLMIWKPGAPNLHY